MDPWEVVQHHMQTSSYLVAHHIDSFNTFCASIETLVRSVEPLEQVRERSAMVQEVLKVRIESVRLGTSKPMVEGGSHLFKVFAQVRVQHVEREGGHDQLVKTEELGELLLCSLPCMVRSSVCNMVGTPWDPHALGGYFVVDGEERMLALTEEADHDVLVVQKGSAKLKGIRVHVVSDTKTHYHGELTVRFSGQKKSHPLFAVMRALGLWSDKEIVECCLLGKDKELLSPLLVPSVHAAAGIQNPTMARAFVGDLEVEDPLQMACTLGRMVRQLLLVQTGARKPTDVRSLECVRLRSAGKQMEALFLEGCRAWKAKWESAEFGDVVNTFRDGREIGKRMLQALTLPVSERVTDLRTVVKRFSRVLTASHFGMYDVVSRKELATMTRLSAALTMAQRGEVLQAVSVTPLQGAAFHEHGKRVRVVVDGEWLGSISDPEQVLRGLNELRRRDKDPLHDLNFTFHEMELNVRTTEGRLQRPLFYMENGRGSWDGSVEKAVVFVDAHEIGSLFIAPNKNTLQKRNTHAEVHGSLVFGQKVNRTMVYADHVPLALTAKTCAFRTAGRFSEVERTVEAETPLVRSGHAPPSLADGVHVTMALLAVENNTLVLNQGAVDRGLFRTYQYVTKYATDSKEYAVGDDAGGWKVHSVTATKKGRAIVLKKKRPVEVGSVFGTRNGVQTVCSAIWAERDMPFNQAGVCPDLILNPHVVGSTSLLLEGLFTRFHAQLGSVGDATAFVNVPSEWKQTDDILTDGKTGRQLQSRVFVAPLYVQRGAEPQGTECHLDEEDKDAAVGIGMASVVRNACMQRGVALPVDAACGVQAVHHAEKNVHLAPELDGPVTFDGQFNPTAHRTKPNRFVAVNLPEDCATLVSELRTMNVQMRFVTRPNSMWSSVDTMLRSTTFRTLSTEPFAYVENQFNVYDSPAECEARQFPTVQNKDTLARLFLGVLDIQPTSDSSVALFNQDKLDLDMYAQMDWRSARHTLLYCFRKMNGGVFVRIRNNRVANFFPIKNAGFSNDVHERFSVDGKAAANPNTLEPLVQQRPSKWVAVGNTVLTPKDDPCHSQLYDMLVNTCSHAVVHDCIVVFNCTEFPYLGVDHLEANPSLFGKGKKMDSVWKKSFVPVLSWCTSADHADLPVPTPEDWECITQRYFASVQKGKPVCRNRFVHTEPTPWDNRTATVARSDENPNDLLPVFFWRGVANGGEHPRTLLTEAARTYRKERKGTMVKPGVLDAAASTHREVWLSHEAETNFIVMHTFKDKDKDEDEDEVKASKMKLVEQAKKYKFTFQVENVGASNRFAALLNLGFCVLCVESPFQLWFERLTDKGGDKLFKGGDVEEFQNDWMFLAVKRDLSNLERTMEWCMQNDAKCKRVAENGKLFYQAYFSKQYVYEYMAGTLNAISARQRVADRTLAEEQSYLKELTSAYDSLAKLPALERHTYDVAAPLQLQKTVLIVSYSGKDQLIALHQFLKHYKNHNIVVVEQAEGEFNRGAVLNAGFMFVKHHWPEGEAVVMLDPAALFPTDFVQRYFANDGKELVDYGPLHKKPLGWAVKVTKGVFETLNGFPNDIASGECEAFENRVRAERVPVYTPSTKVASKTAKEKGTKKEDVRAALVMDALQRTVDGVNTLQYSVVRVKVGNWTLKEPTEEPNIRTLTVRFVPEVELADLRPLQGKDPLEIDPLEVETIEKEPLHEMKVTKLGMEPLKDGGGEPEHLQTIELAHPLLHEATTLGGAVVNVLEDDLQPKEKLAFLHNTDSLEPANVENVKKIAFEL